MAELQQQNDSGEAIHALRDQAFGSAAADRLSQLDRQRSEWQNRTDNFLEQRREILLSKELGSEEKQLRIAALRESQFTANEQRRIKVYEQRGEYN